MENFCNIHSVLSRIKDSRFQLQTANCNFFKKGPSYLGHSMSEQGVAVDSNKDMSWALADSYSPM